MIFSGADSTRSFPRTDRRTVQNFGAPHDRGRTGDGSLVAIRSHSRLRALFVGVLFIALLLTACSSSGTVEAADDTLGATTSTVPSGLARTAETAASINQATTSPDPSGEVPDPTSTSAKSTPSTLVGSDQLRRAQPTTASTAVSDAPTSTTTLDDSINNVDDNNNDNTTIRSTTTSTTRHTNLYDRGDIEPLANRSAVCGRRD